MASGEMKEKNLEALRAKMPKLIMDRFRTGTNKFHGLHTVMIQIPDFIMLDWMFEWTGCLNEKAI